MSFGIFCLLLILNYIDYSYASDEALLSNWKKSTGTGYNGIQADVTGIYYTQNYVFITSNSIPSYSIGPWQDLDYLPSAQNVTYRFSFKPQENLGTKSKAPIGAVGLWIDGVAMNNPDDGMSYKSLGVWNILSPFHQIEKYDPCYGHINRYGGYHNHINPICLYDSTDSSKHSPLLGYLFDSFPIYGPFGYSSPYDSSSSIKRITSSYQTRDIKDRTTLSNGTVLSSTYYGPALDSDYPLGFFLEDYEYVEGLGDLDQYNGRWCVTPEYPYGTYAYFVTTDSNGDLVYPYTIARFYYGQVSGTNPTSISSRATQYFKA
jgi:hypothetical protein